ncbi:helix-turn-helix transcriptional regulator [Pantoea sp. GD03673]|uniref:helix-turn-helix domain-containing protein n=1 Tax=Pantoea sp. GD03673 TaxID=2975364 RepID=UPI0024495FD5|nr:helix-turn-helix transcriptional regulator [Pantoea sp. GD03673]MDH2066874.1 helix-turn-helix domain-containing protein [Pantoea sp. GD03673]
MRFNFYFDDNQPVPVTGPVTCDVVEASAKLLLLKAFLVSCLTQVELALRMGVKKQEVTRIFDLQHSTKIDTVQIALNALGKRLELVAA